MGGRLPQAIAVALLAAVAIEAAAVAITTALVQIGIAVGVSYLASKFLAPKVPSVSPTDRQFTNKGSAMPRFRSYGTVRVAGAQQFMNSANGTLYRVVAHNDGEIDAVLEHLIDDNIVTLDGSGSVTTAKYQYGGQPMINLQWRMGVATPAHYATLGSVFPEWDATHLGKGVAHSLLAIKSPASNVFYEMFPNAERTTYKQTIRASKVWDPRDIAQDANDESTWEWSANAALVTLDYLRHRTGYGMPLDWLLPEIESWNTAADICDEPVARKAGGTAARYEINTTYTYDERPADVLGKMLAAWNAKILIGPNGGIAASAGAWVEPSITIDDDAITSYAIGSGNEGPDTANTIAVVYTEANLGYRETDAEPWVIPDLVAKFGEQRVASEFFEISSHSQSRRIAKQAAAKLAPSWKGSLRTNIRALSALSERFVRIKISELDLDFTAEIEGIEFDIVDGTILRGLVIEFSAITADAFEWDAATEEGEPSEVPPVITNDGIPAPTGFAIATEQRSGAVVAVATWDAISSVTTTVSLEYKASSSSDWLIGGSAVPLSATLETPPLVDGSEYNFRIRAQGILLTSPYAATITQTVVSDSVAPSVPLSLATAKAGSTVTVSWTNPNSSNCDGAKVYRNTSNTPASATLIATVYGGPNVAMSHADAGLANGTYWWWVATFNGSGIESARTLAGTQTIP